MRLIRHPWKGCLCRDVPFTIPWKGSKLEKDICENWGSGFEFWLCSTCCTCSRMVIGGWGGVITIWTSIIHGPLNLVPLLTCWYMLHILSYSHQGVGGCDNVLDEYYTWPTELGAAVNMLHMLSYGHQGAGGVITFLTSIIHGPRNLLPLCARKKRVLLGLQLDMAS